MPRWYFHIHDGKEATLDQEGTDLPDLITAHEEALIVARELMSNGPRDGRDRSRWRFEIADETGAPILMVLFSEAVQERSG